MIEIEEEEKMQIGKKQFDIEHEVYIMGILNVTPDSFSDGGQWNQLDKGLYHVEEMIREGADIIDIGGESTRPGYRLLPDEEEIERILPFIEGVKSRFDIPISIDTYKSRVATEAIKHGADLVNDIWGLKYDKELAHVIAKNRVACCLMHNRKEIDYQDFMPDLIEDLKETVVLAKEAGIPDECIMLDPGVGFAKTNEQNLEAIQRVDELHALGYPILLGTSRKSVVGITLDLPRGERLEGTLVTTVFGVLKGCSFIRVHDIKENRRTIDMTRAILQAGKR